MPYSVLIAGRGDTDEDSALQGAYSQVEMNGK